jgi:HEAT repeat protein
MKEKVVMSIFKHLPSHNSVPFFLETMEQADNRLKAIYLRSCRQFKDPEIVFYVRKYLNHPSARLRSHAVMALWSFEDKSFLRQKLYALLHSSDSENHISALYAFGEIQDIESMV